MLFVIRPRQQTIEYQLFLLFNRLLGLTTIQDYTVAALTVFFTLLLQLYEYNDVHDNGYLEGDSKRHGIPLSRVSWQLSDVIRTEEEVMVQMHGAISHKEVSGSIDVRVRDIH